MSLTVCVLLAVAVGCGVATWWLASRRLGDPMPESPRRAIERTGGLPVGSPIFIWIPVPAWGPAASGVDREPILARPGGQETEPDLDSSVEQTEVLSESAAPANDLDPTDMATQDEADGDHRPS